jgi:hypothetical protein
MSPTLIQLLSYFTLALLGGWFSYHMRCSKACRLIANKILEREAASVTHGDSEAVGELQSAIEPKRLEYLFYSCFAVTAAIIFFHNEIIDGLHGFGIMVAIYAGAALAGAIVIPRTEASYWTRLVHAALRARARRYARDGRHQKADATTGLATRVEAAFPEALESVQATR